MEAGDKLPVTLSVSEWNAVLGALNEAPYRISAPIIQAMMQQLQPRPIPSVADHPA